MKVESIETLLVAIIVSIQLWVFIRTFVQIRVFRKIIPDIALVRISRVLVPVSDLEKLSPREILENIEAYKNPPESILTSDTGFDNPDEGNNWGKAEVSIIDSPLENSHVLDRILFSINNYLIRNRGAASDFGMIKDIVERNSSAVEEDINISIAVPLYLGLMGTMMGIVIGLFNMPNLGVDIQAKTKDALLNEGISLMIGGVRIAMIASFSGLLLTVINSGWNFKTSRSVIEARKNEFYTFVQIELLPIINQGLASTLESLQRNLLKFNGEFTTNLRQLSGIFDSNTRAIKAQKELLDAIDKTKVAEMTKYNVKVLAGLEVSVREFEKFNQHLTNVNIFVEHSQNIVSRTNELLARTDNFQAIADNIDQRLTESQELLLFLRSHFGVLEDRRKVMETSIIGIDNTITEALNHLKEHTQNSIKRVQEFTIDEVNALKAALSESKTNLSNLEHLAPLHLDVAQFRTSSTSQGERVYQQLNELNAKMSKTIALFEEARQASRPKSITASIRRLFKSKK